MKNWITRLWKSNVKMDCYCICKNRLIWELSEFEKIRNLISWSVLISYIYMRTDQILITSCKNRNRPVLKNWEPPNTALYLPMLGVPVNDTGIYNRLVYSYGRYPYETGAFHILQLRQFRNAIEWRSVLHQIDDKQAAARCTVVPIAAGITVFLLFSPKESTGVYSWSVLGHWNPENSYKFLWWFGGSWWEKEMRKKGRRPPYEASETQVESGRIQEGRTKEGRGLYTHA